MLNISTFYWPFKFALLFGHVQSFIMRWKLNNYRLKFCTYTFVRPSSVECRIVSFNHISLPYPYIEIKSKRDLITDYHFNIMNLGIDSYTLTIIISISILSHLKYFFYLQIVIKRSFFLKMDRTGCIYDFCRRKIKYGILLNYVPFIIFIK